MMNFILESMLSKTMWGALIGLVSTVAKLTGYEIAIDDVPATVNDIVNIVATGLVVWGRATAKGPITGEK
jgi:uncharacterized membrane protein